MAIDTSSLVQASALIIFQDPPIFFSMMGFKGVPQRVAVGIVRVELLEPIPVRQIGFSGGGGGGAGVPVVINLVPDVPVDPEREGVSRFQIELYTLDGTPVDTGCSITFFRLPAPYIPPT